MPSTVLKARFKDSDDIVVADTLLLDAKLTLKLSESGTFSFTMADNTYAAQEVAEGGYCEIFDGSNILIQGYITDVKQTNRSGKMTLQVKGRDLTDEVYKARAMPTSYYEDITFIGLLAQLLFYTGWRLGEIGTAQSILDNTVGIDLRNESNLMAQVQKLLDKEAGVTFRYGGIEAGYPTIDIGVFGENGHVQLFTTPFANAVKDFVPNIGAVVEYEVKQTNDELIYELEPYGGEIDDAGVSRPASMEDHLRHGGTDTLSQDPDFPIIETVSGVTFSVLNPDLLGEGGEIQIRSDNSSGIIHIGDVTDIERMYAHRFYCWPGWLKQFGFMVISNSISTGSNVWLRIWSDNAGAGPLPDQVLWEYNLGDVAQFSANNMYYFDFERFESVYLDLGTPYWWSLQHDANISTNQRLYLSSQLAPDAGVQQGGIAGTTGVTSTYPATPSWNSGYFPTYTLHSTIVTEGDEPHRGISKRITWNEYTPEYTSGPLSLASLTPVVKSMYERARAFLEEKSQVWHDYKIKAIGTSLFPELGDKVYVSYVDKQQIRDEFRQDFQQVTTQLQEWLTCLAINVDYKGGKVSWSFDLTDGYAVKPESVVTSIYDTRTTPQRVGAGAEFQIVPTLATVQEIYPLATAADTTMSDGRPAKLVEFTTLPSPTSNSGRMIPGGMPYVVTGSATMDIEMVSWGDLNDGVVTSPVARIAPINGWNFSHYVTMECKLIFIG
jgi:hypothetical protein